MGEPAPTRCINGGPGLGGVYALQDAANALQEAYPDNVVSLDVRGSMQAASGSVDPPFPNLDHFTPSSCVIPSAPLPSAPLPSPLEALETWLWR
eukprot:SAG11_NODE_1660_length_4498_cov_5.293021_3_plen_94_part_00